MHRLPPTFLILQICWQSTAWTLLRPFLLALLPSFLLLQVDLPAAAAPLEDPINYDQHIAAILKSKCGVCHGDGKQEAGLALSSYAGVVQGSGGGRIVIAGQSAQSKLLEVLTTDDANLRMPPDSDPLTKAQIELVKSWIDSGLRENAGSSAAKMRTLGFIPSATTADPSLDSNEVGPLPQNYPSATIPPTARPFPVLSLSASPRAPLIAKSNYGAIDLLAPDDGRILGTLPFPEGEPLAISFSRSGRLLLAAGGKPVRNGSAVLYDVASGKRVASVADETDAILAADISPDERFVAIGCTSRLIKVYSTEDGSIVTTIDKHTDWATAVAYSPDGRTLATADRIGNVYLWDSQTGGALFSLIAHKKSVRSLHWRSDSRILASSSEDGTLIWWDAKEGWPTIQKPNAHSQGVLDAKFGPGGELASCGRDRTVRVWSPDGTELKKFSVEPPPESSAGIAFFPLRVAISANATDLLAGDSNGKVHRWSLK